MKTYKIIDTPWYTTLKIECLKKASIHTVIRYYNNGNSRKLFQKRLELDEALALSRGGLNIMVVFQAINDNASDFSIDKGHVDGQHAYNWAKDTISQPAGSAIYFAVDYDASRSDLENDIIPYFKGVKEAFEDLSDGNLAYDIGAYGSGLVVNTLKEQELIKYRWLSMSTGFRGTRNALNTGAYELHQVHTFDSKVCGINVDYDLQNPEVDSIGSFMLNEKR